MKIATRYLLPSLRSLLILTLLLAPAAAGAARPDLTARLNEGAIIKDITIPEGQPWAYVRVQAIIDSAPAVVWSLLEDIERWPSWLPMNRKAQFLSPAASQQMTKEVARDRDRILAIISANPGRGPTAKQPGHWEQMVYEEYDLPWPIQNEWVLRRYTFDEKEGVDRASWKKVDSEDDQDDGDWIVRPWEEGKKTHLSYYYRVKAKEGVPKAVFRTAVGFVVNSMIKAVRHESAKLTAKIAGLPPKTDTPKHP